MTTRKRSRRYDTELYALWRGEGPVKRVLLEDFSETGCRVANTLSAEVGSEVILEFFLNEDPEQGPTRVFADVVRHQSDGVGLLFSEMTDEAREEIEFFLFEHFAKESSSAIPIAPAGPPIQSEVSAAPAQPVEEVKETPAPVSDFFFDFGAKKTAAAKDDSVPALVDVSALNAIPKPKVSPFDPPSDGVSSDAVKRQKEQAAKEQAAREQAAREQAAREQAAREQAARDEIEQERAAQLAKHQAEVEAFEKKAALAVEAQERAAQKEIADANARADAAVRQSEAYARELAEQTSKKRENDELIIVESSDPKIPVVETLPKKSEPSPVISGLEVAEAPRVPAAHPPRPMTQASSSSSWPKYALIVVAVVTVLFLLQQCVG